VARQLGTAILSGQLAPGSSLDGEIVHAQALGVSRTPYREALKILVAKGLIESRPKVGTRVTPRERWNLLDPEVLGWMFTGEPDREFVRDLFELRAVIEPAAAALAAQRRTGEEVETLHAALTDMARHTLATAEGRAADRRFHDAMLKASGNAALAALTSTIGAAVHWTTDFKARAGTVREAIDDHYAVLEAIAAQDPARARQAMEALIAGALVDMRLDDSRAETAGT